MRKRKGFFKMESISDFVTIKVKDIKEGEKHWHVTTRFGTHIGILKVLTHDKTKAGDKTLTLYRLTADRWGL